MNELASPRSFPPEELPFRSLTAFHRNSPAPRTTEHRRELRVHLTRYDIADQLVIVHVHWVWELKVRFDPCRAIGRPKHACDDGRNPILNRLQVGDGVKDT